MLSCADAKESSNISEQTETVVFTGFEGSKCSCCWGYEITLEDGQRAKGAKFSSELNLSETTTTTFPFNAIIKYNTIKGCSDNIEITYFEKVK